jgi:tRNA dimethylallyltransferase
VIAIVGPTAIGKSELALHLAHYFPIEIISADSRQVYRYMDIGTNKPSLAERESVPHYLIDVIDPDHDFSLAMYHRLAIEALKTIKQKSKLPLLVGGSGLYVWSLIEGWEIPRVPPDQKQRSQLEARVKQEGSQNLYQELQDIDPIVTAKINPSNTRRIIRALEIYHATGQRPSQLQRKEAPDFPILLIGLTRERSELYRKIDWRVDKMIQMGLVEEVEQLLKKGYNLSLPSMSGIGYKQICQFLQGDMTLPQAIDKIKYETHRLARHQYTWFRLRDSRIHWFDSSGAEAETNSDFTGATLNKVKSLIESFLS